MDATLLFRPLVAAALSLLALAASAQVPKHAPGTVCFTPRLWCWAQPPGQPGSACSCSTPYGRAAGTLG
ncbi:MAG: hypothetical protein ABJA77_05085 [Variovorax sp.]